jgi:hypothetical protein
MESAYRTTTTTTMAEYEYPFLLYPHPLRRVNNAPGLPELGEECELMDNGVWIRGTLVRNRFNRDGFAFRAERRPPEAPRRSRPVPTPRDGLELGDIRHVDGVVGQYMIGEYVERWYYRWSPEVIVAITPEGRIWTLPISHKRFNRVCERCRGRGHTKDRCFEENDWSREFDKANPSLCNRCGCTTACGAVPRQGQPTVALCRSTNQRAMAYDRRHPRPIHA